MWGQGGRGWQGLGLWRIGGGGDQGCRGGGGRGGGGQGVGACGVKGVGVVSG